MVELLFHIVFTKRGW